MTAKYYDVPASEDTVRLLSNPLNSETLQSDEQEHSDEHKTNNGNYCQTCSSASNGDIANFASPFIDNDISLSNNFNGDCHHCHQFIPNQSTSHSESKLILAMCLCVLFMVAEIVGGYVAGSLSVMTDGAHLLTDVVGFLISLLAITSSKRRCSKKFNLGFYRIEVLATLISILLIWIMTAIFMYLAIIRLIGNNYEIEADIMMLVSSLGVIINIVMFSVLHGRCNSQHMHSHQISDNNQAGQNINVRAAMIHVIGDLVQSIGVFLSSLIIKFYPHAKFMDPVCTFLFSIIVIFSTLRLLKDSIYIVMEAFPNNIDYNSILRSLQGLNGVRHVHSLNVWSLTLNSNVLTVHLAVDDSVDRDVVLLQAQRLVSKKFNIILHTIQIEKYHSKCMHTCQHCRPLWD